MRFTVRDKMIVGFGLVLILLITITGVAYLNITKLNAVLNEITDMVVPTGEKGDELIAVLWEANTVAKEQLAEEDMTKLADFEEKFETLAAKYREADKVLKKLAGGNEDLLNEVKGADTEFKGFINHAHELFDVHRAGLEKEQKVTESTQQFENVTEELLKTFAEMTAANEQASQEIQKMADFKTVEATQKLNMLIAEALETVREYLALQDSTKLPAVRKEFSAASAMTEEYVQQILQGAKSAQEKTDATQLAELIVQFKQFTLDEDGLFDKHQEQLEVKSQADRLTGLLETDTNNTVEILNKLVEATEKGENLITTLWEANKVAQEHLAEEDLTKLETFEQEFETLVKTYRTADKELGEAIGYNPDLAGQLEGADREFEAFVTHAREIFAAHRLVLGKANSLRELTQNFEGVAEKLKGALEKMAAFREQQYKMAQEMSEKNSSVVETTLKLNKLIGDALETTREYLAIKDLEKLPAIRKEFTAVTTNIAEYEQQLLDTAESEQRKTAVQQLSELIDRFETSVMSEHELFDKHKEQLEAEYQANALVEELEKDVKRAVAFFDEMVVLADALFVSADERGAKAVKSATMLISILASISIVIGLGTTIIMTQSIVKALGKGVKFAEAIAKGDLNATIDITQKDEFGTLANALGEMKEKIAGVVQEIHTLIQAIQNGRLDTRGNPELFAGGWRELIFGVNNVIDAFVAPFNVTAEYIDRISKGNIPEKITEEYKGDFNEIKNNLNQLIASLDAIIGEISSGTGVLLDSVQDLTVSAQEISSTANQQAAAVKEIVSTMEDSDQLTKSITGKIGEVTEMTTTTKQVVNDGFSVIQESLAKMDDIKGANTETITEMKALGDKIASIWEIVNMINDIADQTKIIAFNAELEASSAGDAGKNFQIVASEIRRLADSTVASTSEIKAKINEIQQSSDRLIFSSEEGTTKITEGWDLSKNLQKLFENVLSSADVSAGATDQIALSIKQQASAFEQILQTIKQIAEGIDNFVTSTRATTDSSTKLKEMANTLHTVIENFGGNEQIADEQIANEQVDNEQVDNEQEGKGEENNGE